MNKVISGITLAQLSVGIVVKGSTAFLASARCEQISRKFSKNLSKKMAGKYKIVMVRHGESEWNLKNQFCGWYDAELSENGK